VPSCPLPRFRERIQFEMALVLAEALQCDRGVGRTATCERSPGRFALGGMRATGARHPTRTPSANFFKLETIGFVPVLTRSSYPRNVRRSIVSRVGERRSASCQLPDTAPHDRSGF
jgi:hypothetical protein